MGQETETKMTKEQLLIEERLTACKTAREIAAQSLGKALGGLLSRGNFSELDLANLWRREMRRHHEILPDGWYTPNDIGVLIGPPKRNSRPEYTSLREPENGPKADVILRPGNVAYLYGSPVIVSDGAPIIGDCGLVFSQGEDKDVRNHLKKCLAVDNEVFNVIKVGMAFREIYALASQIVSEHGLTGEVPRTGGGLLNFGHTVPFTNRKLTKEEKRLFFSEEPWEKRARVISKARLFINQEETAIFDRGMAITFEPRLVPKDGGGFMGSYHVIMMAHSDGRTELLTNFDKIPGMEWLFKS